MASQYEKECIYLHEESGLCKYGEDCERQNCMYQHKRVKTIKSNIDNENIQDVIDASDDDSSDEEKHETEDIDSETDGEDDTERIDQTFVNPSQSDDGNTDEEIKTDEHDAIEEVINYECEVCIFKTTDGKRFKRHQFENHSVKGKYVCIGCKKTI